MKFPPPLQRLLKIILESAQKKKVKLFLVGGYLRDMLLEREKENPDIDFCLRKGAIDFARKLAREIKAGFVVLDKVHGCARLVKRIKDKVYTLDFTDFRGKNLEDDLKLRDFTLNALSAELEKVLLKIKLEDLCIDPCSGRKDLAAKTIRMVNKKAFDADPLRLLRAFSLSATLDFKIDKETLKIIKLKAKKLAGISWERIRDELFKILERPDSFTYLLQLDKLKLLKIIIPEIELMRGVNQGPYHHLDVWRHTLETVREFELLNAELKHNKEIQGYLDELISSQHCRRSLIKLGALLHDVGKPAARRREDGKTKFHGHERIGLEITKNIVQRLRLSNDELEALGKMVLWHLRPGYLADNAEITPRARFRYFRDSAKEGASILLLSLADQRATRGRLTTKQSRIRHERAVFSLLKEYFKKEKECKPARLINGDDLMKKFKLEPSPLIGKILGEIEELQAIGKIKTKKAALAQAQEIILKHKA